MSRPSKVGEWETAEGLAEIERLTSEVGSISGVAKKVHLDRATLTKYMKDNSAISAAFKKGQEEFYSKRDDKIKAAYDKGTIKLLTGYYVNETAEEITEHPDGSITKRTRNTRRWVEPNSTMTIFEKKHQEPEKYGDKVVPTSTDSGKEMDSLSASLMALAKELEGND